MRIRRVITIKSNSDFQDSASWAKGLKQDHLRTVLWLVGDFRLRGHAIKHLLQELLAPMDAKQKCRRAFGNLMKLCCTPAEGTACVDPALPVVSDRLRQGFPAEKHARWAIDPTDAGLHVILATTGTFARDADPLLDLLFRNVGKTSSRYQFFRASFALKSLVQIVRIQRSTTLKYGVRMNARPHALYQWFRSDKLPDDFALEMSR